MSNSVFIKVTSAFMLGGHIARAGEVVEVDTAEAKSLLARGKAVVATKADAPSQADVTEKTEAKAAKPKSKP